MEILLFNGTYSTSNLFPVNVLFFSIFTLLSLAYDTVYFLYFIMLLCCSLINIIVRFESLIVLSVF